MANLIKFSYLHNMSYDVSDLEKQRADKAIICFDQAIKDMYKSTSYLNLIKEPFEKDPNINSEEISDIRSKLREYRDDTIEKFNDFKKSASIALSMMDTFSSDTQTIKLMKAFVSCVEDIEESVNEFAKTFSELESADFVKNILEKINDIQDSCAILEEIVYDRIIKHIKTNILASSWIDSVSNSSDLFNKKEPLILELQKKLH